MDDIIEQMRASQGDTGTDQAADPIIEQMRVGEQAQRSQAALSLSDAIDTNGDQAGVNRQIAKQFNIPPAVVEQFPNEYRQRVATQMAHDTLAQSPVLQKQINEDPSLASITHDDTKNLSAIEQVGTDTLNALPDYGKALARSANSLIKDIVMMPTAGVTMAIDKAFGSNLTDKVFGGAQWLEQANQNIALRPDAGFVGKASDMVGGLLGMVMESEVTAGPKLVTEGASQATTLWPTLSRMVQHGTAAMAAPSLVSAVEAGQQVYDETGDGMAAWNAAKAHYATNTLMGMVPMSAPGSLLARAAGGFVAGVSSGELGRQYTNANMPDTMQQKPDFEEAMLQGLMGAGFGVMGPKGAAPGLHDAIRQTYVDHAKAEAAVQDHTRLDILGQLSEVSKLRGRDPEAFNKFVSDVTEDGRLKDVYIDAKVFKQEMDKAGVTPEQLNTMLPDVAAQMHEDTITKGTIQIPIGDYAEKVMGGDLDKALMPHIRTLDPNSQELGMTYKEQEDFFANEVEDMKAKAKSISEAHGEDQAWQASSDAVHDKILQDIQENTLMPQHIALVNARLKSLAVDTIARRTNKTPEEAYEQYGAAFTGKESAGDNFEQAAGTRHEDLESRLTEKLKDHAAAVKEYNALKDSEGGRVLNVDTARELSPDYLKDRTRSGAVHEPASVFIKKLFADRLAEHEHPAVLFTAGGTGAGKSSAIKSLPVMKAHASSADIIYDTNMGDYGKALEKIQQVLKQEGGTVRVAIVIRDPVDALVNGALPRAMRQEAEHGSGRTVPIAEHVKTHEGSLATVLKLVEKFKNNDRIQFNFIDNNHGAGNAKEIDVSEATKIKYNNIEAKVKAALEKEHQDEKITDTIYEGFRDSKDAAKGTGESKSLPFGERRRSGSEPQQEREGRFNQVDQTQKQKAEAAGFDTSTIWLHGTTADVKAFKVKTGGVNELGPGVYLSSDPTETYFHSRKEGGRTIQAYVKKGDVFDLAAFLRDIGQQVGDSKNRLTSAYSGIAQRIIDDPSRLPDTAKGWAKERVGDLAEYIRSTGLENINKWLEYAGYVGAKDHTSQYPNQLVVFEPKNIRSINAKFSQSKLDSANLLHQKTDQTTTPEFKAWAGTDKPVIAASDINDTDFRGGGPFVIRAYHSTTHDFTEFNASIKGNMEGQFGRVNYFTSSRVDAADNYAGEGPDLTGRIEQRAERIVDDIQDEHDNAMSSDEGVGALKEKYGEDVYDEDTMQMARNLARKEMHGGDEKVLQLFIKTEKPFVIGGDKPSRLELYDEAEIEKEALQNVADSEGVSVEEVRDNLDEYQDALDDERWALIDQAGDPVADAVRKVAARYGDEQVSLMSALWELSSDGAMRHTDLERILRGDEGLAYAQDPENGDLAQSQIIGEVLKELGFDSIILKDAGERFPNMNIGGGVSHIHVFDEDNTHIKSASDNSGAFDLNNPDIYRQLSRGFYSPEQRMIGVLKDANLSTFNHELGHWLVDQYSKIAAMPDAPVEIKDDVDALFRFAKVPGDTPEARLTNWHEMNTEQQRPYHELLAEAHETYFMEGKAPTIELQGVFSRIMAWMEAVYRDLSTRMQLTPEVRQAYDRMYASDEQIKQAQQARGYWDKFLTPPEDTSAADIKALEDLGTVATQAASDQMRAKSLRDMQWLSGAKNEAERRIQKAANAARRKIMEDVTKQVDEMPVYRAERWLRTGKRTDNGVETELSPEARKGAKISSEDLRTMYPETALARPDLSRLSGMTSPRGMHPDLIAETFHGFGSGDALVRALADMQPKREVIKGLTDRRMLEEHGEVATPDGIARAAEEAIHNDFRAKFMATNLKILTKAPIPVGQIVKGAKMAADGAIAAQKVGKVNERKYMAAEMRNNKEALKLIPKDPKGAADAQRAALLNNQLVKSSLEAKAEIAKILNYVKRFDKKPVMKKMDVDIRDQITALLAQYDMRQNPPLGPTKEQTSLRNWIDTQIDAGYTPNVDPSILDNTAAKHYKDMTVGEFRALHDTVRMIEKLGQERKMMTIDGIRTTVREAANATIEKMKQRGDKFTDAQLAERPRKDVDPLWQITLDRAGSLMRTLGSEMLPQHFKANRYDMHEIMGPFHKYIFEPVFSANYRFLDMARAVSEDFRAKAQELGGTAWQKTLNDVVENHKLADNSLETPAKRRLTRGDLIGIALHVGNESNFDKLIKGMGWQPKDVWQALHDNMRSEDWQAAKMLGETAGKHWPEIDAMNRRLGNTSPQKIEPRPFMTKFGEMPGWYAPIKYDPIRSKLGRKKADAGSVNPADGLFSQQYYRADTTTNGSLNARSAGYHDIIDLDWHSIEKAIHDSLRDLAYRETLTDVHKLYTDRQFRVQFQRSYGTEEYKKIGEWLGRMVNSEVGDEKQSKWVAMAASTRRAIVANGIAFRISTMEKHGGSAALKSVGYLAGGGEKYFLARAKAMGTNHSKEVVEGLAKSRELRARAQQQDRDFSQRAASLMEPESVHAKAERFGHAGVAYMDFFTAVPTFHAAYDWATTEGVPERLGGTGKPMSHEDAAKWADSIVREAHGTNIESGRSQLINTKSEFLKALTMLHGFMNNSFGQHMDAYDKMVHSQFGKPELLARYMMTQIVPAMLAGYITFGTKVDDQPWWQWAAGVIGSEFAGEVPAIREAYKAVVEGYDAAGLPPWMDALKDIAKVVKDVAKGDEAKQPIKDAGNAGGLFLPGLGQGGSTLQFLYDVKSGAQQPETVADWWRGVTSGKMDVHP